MRRAVRHLGRAFAAFLGAMLAACAPASAMQQAFLVQNSGWMEPFYADPSSQFKPLASAVIRLVSAPDDDVFVSAFNQTSGSNMSPALLAKSRGPGQPEAALADLKVATKNRAGALADTDFQEAVTHVITEQFQAKPGIVWIFTNNKNSPNNDTQTALRNQDFYRLLHLEPSITRTIVFPLQMPVKGRLFTASGMMVYALAYGDEAGDHLARLVDSGRFRTLFTSPPARLKPLDQDSVRLVPVGVSNTDNVAVGLAKDGRTLLLDVQASEVLPQVVVKTRLENLFFPYVISEANASASMVGAWGKEGVPAQPDRFEGIQPGESREVSIAIPMPLAQVPSPWSAAAISAMGKQLTIPATLEVSLEGQRLILSEGFKRSLNELFPGDPLPEVFAPPDSVRSSSVSLPMLIRVQYPLLPVIVALLLVLALLVGLGGVAMLAGRTARYDVMIDGSKRSVAIKAFKSADVRDDNGAVVGRLARSLGAPKVVNVVDGHSIEVKRPK